MHKKTTKKYVKGFTLVELMLGLVIVSISMTGYFQWNKHRVETERAREGGAAMKEVGDAYAAYLARENEHLKTVIPPGTTITIPYSALQGVASGNVRGVRLLGLNHNNANPLGFNYVLQARNIGGVVEGLLISSSPVCQYGNNLPCPSAQNPVKPTWANLAMQRIGSRGGTIDHTNTLRGLGGLWSETAASYNSINSQGKVAYRVNSSLTDAAMFDGQYLRLDGTNRMKADLDVGNWNIKNVTDITYNGWARGNGLVANIINAGNVNVAGDVQALNVTAGLAMAAPSMLAKIGITIGEDTGDPDFTAFTTMEGGTLWPREVIKVGTKKHFDKRDRVPGGFAPSMGTIYDNRSGGPGSVQAAGQIRANEGVRTMLRKTPGAPCDKYKDEGLIAISDGYITAFGSTGAILTCSYEPLSGRWIWGGDRPTYHAEVSKKQACGHQATTIAECPPGFTVVGGGYDLAFITKFAQDWTAIPLSEAISYLRTDPTSVPFYAYAPEGGGPINSNIFIPSLRVDGVLKTKSSAEHAISPTKSLPVDFIDKEGRQRRGWLVQSTKETCYNAWAICSSAPYGKRDIHGDTSNMGGNGEMFDPIN